MRDKGENNLDLGLMQGMDLEGFSYGYSHELVYEERHRHQREDITSQFTARHRVCSPYCDPSRCRRVYTVHTAAKCPASRCRGAKYGASPRTRPLGLAARCWWDRIGSGAVVKFISANKILTATAKCLDDGPVELGCID